MQRSHFGTSTIVLSDTYKIFLSTIKKIKFLNDLQYMEVNRVNVSECVCLCYVCACLLNRSLFRFVAGTFANREC